MTKEAIVRNIKVIADRLSNATIEPTLNTNGSDSFYVFASGQLNGLVMKEISELIWLADKIEEDD